MTQRELHTGTTDRSGRGNGPGRAETARRRTLTLLRYLREHSDEDHPVTTGEIRTFLARAGYPVSVGTLRRDILALTESGYDLETLEEPGRPTRYIWLDRSWSVAELRMLADAVIAARCIPEEQSRAILRKLTNSASPSDRPQLAAACQGPFPEKTRNREILYTVQAVHQAISWNKRLVYQSPRPIPLSPAAGASERLPACVLSPWATLWHNGLYFVIGYLENDRRIAAVRADRMLRATVMKLPRRACPKELRPREILERELRKFPMSP